MNQKEQLITLLKDNSVMTQGQLAEAIYADKNHGPAIYASLMKLVESGIVIRSGSHPAYYSLSGSDIVIPQKESTIAVPGTVKRL